MLSMSGGGLVSLVAEKVFFFLATFTRLELATYARMLPKKKKKKRKTNSSFSKVVVGATVYDILPFQISINARKNAGNSILKSHFAIRTRPL